MSRWLGSVRFPPIDEVSRQALGGGQDVVRWRQGRKCQRGRGKIDGTLAGIRTLYGSSNRQHPHLPAIKLWPAEIPDGVEDSVLESIEGSLL